MVDEQEERGKEQKRLSDRCICAPFLLVLMCVRKSLPSFSWSSCIPLEEEFSRTDYTLEFVGVFYVPSTLVNQIPLL